MTATIAASSLIITSLPPSHPPRHSSIYNHNYSSPKSKFILSNSKPLFVATAVTHNNNNSPTSIMDDLGDVTIFRASGEAVTFKSLMWDEEVGDGFTVVALLRHFGCPCCWELASTLKESKARFDSAGVKLIAVGVGTPTKARILAQRAYNVLNLYYGFGRTFFNPASTKVFSRFDALRKAVKNYTIEATPDDTSGVLQQGGMFVFRGKQLLYARKDEGTGDHAPLDDIFDVCCKAPVS
ncbi:PREDICTED: thioredoxin-like protein AAED1, chloroplastic isoform X2 [Lupinus angustifolius]|uniref:thioredoxin-like protein AAED1, chloroplastic isoform X2 n=1 Tax=Lupinus angustifolius TaxID=3871 RepID=UPI00092F9CA0|nr:PREDICTED: thioredoxin-like protein AAED1, chloroplastic isoform X2 [Lupinus angustifolius]